MRRRAFIGIFGGALMWPFAGRGQVPGKRPLIVWFGSATAAAASSYIGFVREGLGQLGLVEGRNFDFAARFAENNVERLPAVASEVVALNPAVIVASASNTALAAKKATSTIPVVSAALADAEHLGLVATYARPGGNVTGLMPYVDGLPAKQIELAHELMPGATKIGLLGDNNDPKVRPQLDELKVAAGKLGYTIVVSNIDAPNEIEGAIKSLANEHVDVAIVLQSTLMLSVRRQIALLMAANRMPALYGYREHVDAGGLISYGVDLKWCWHHLATYIQKLLTGTSPADLPVEFPTKIQMVLNLKTAKELGITLAPMLLAQADEVIE